MLRCIFLLFITMFWSRCAVLDETVNSALSVDLDIPGSTYPSTQRVNFSVSLRGVLPTNIDSGRVYFTINGTLPTLDSDYVELQTEDPQGVRDVYNEPTYTFSAKENLHIYKSWLLRYRAEMTIKKSGGVVFNDLPDAVMQSDFGQQRFTIVKTSDDSNTPVDANARLKGNG